MRRILVMTSTFPAHAADGVPAFVLDIARSQAERLDVTVLTPRVRGAAAREVVDGVKVVRFGYLPRAWERVAEGAILDNVRASPALWLQVPFLLIAEAVAARRLVRRIGVDAIHAHWAIPQGLIARLIAPQTPLLVTSHGGDLYALNRGPVALLKRWTLRGADRVTTVNADMAARLHTWGVASDRVTVLPMGVPLAETAAVPVRAVEGRMVAVGRLVEKKGFAVLIDALRRHTRFRDGELVIAGDGPLRARLERQGRNWNVHFAGQLSRREVLATLASAEIAIVPSVPASSGDQEGLPVVLLEAAALGCAIIASDLPGLNEALRHEREALLVPPGDPAALGAAIERLRADPALRARLGDAARRRSQFYSVERIGGAYTQLMVELAEGPLGGGATSTSLQTA